MDKQKALAAIDGLTFADCAEFFDSRATERDRRVAEMIETSDELNVDWSITSEGDDNGAWVLCWAWASFADTDLDKGM